MGLEAALGALEHGFDVTVLEKDRVGSALLRWGRTRFFSPLGMNVSDRVRRVLGSALPPDDALLTGAEMVERVLEPLARSALLAGRVRTGHRVVGVGRSQMTRSELVGHPLRAERPFRLLVETPEGERTFEAESVLDASGVGDNPASVGAGGLPARGERSSASRMIRHLGLLEAQLPRLAGRRVLLVGNGHSAANALALLERLSPPASVTWAVRSSNRRPCLEVAGDPLPERQAVTAHANDLAADPPAYLKVERRAEVTAIEARNGGFDVTLSGGRGVECDAIVGLTGYRPDLSFLSELALEISPVSESGAGLARVVAGAADCLSAPVVRPQDLLSGEPGFHFVGGKSYGRLNTFLLKTGLAHLEAILLLLHAKPA
jgi:NADPH-dependent 2,4-dienoyl-CoA reductase/sulfur reductase-like enzyme